MGCWDGSEIGFALGRDHWGQGYASEALVVVLDHLYSDTARRYLRPDNTPDTSLPLILKADVDPRNTGSLALLKKYGFRETGRAERTFQTHIGWCDSVYLHLDARGPVPV